jgi:nitrous oxide reductase accessory protein NosL
MKILLTLSILCLLLACTLAKAAENVEGPAACQQCGMDRTVFARSRVLITYADGTTAGECSIHCATAEMKKSGNKEIKTLMVADYNSKELTDAKTATWVVGGAKEGVMTSVAKWAFARDADARQFVRDNGGTVTTFDQVMKAASEEADRDAGGGHDHHGHMGPGAQLIFNPAFGDDIYHTHPAGMWMINYRYMHMNMSGLQSGANSIPVSIVSPVGSKPFGYMMTPTGMTMDMSMVMAMVGVTDNFTLMGMVTYQSNQMEMLMNMGMGGMGNQPQDAMRTRGVADSELRGIYGLTRNLVASLGFSLPTGSTKQTIEMMGMTFRAPYDMQLGSGTFDLKPALTYSALSDDAKWNWGGQAMYTWHMGKNQGYSLGDSIKVTSWIQRAFGPFSSWLRLAFNDTGRIKGRDPEIDRSLDPMMGAPMPDADPRNYGGERLDALAGVSLMAGPVAIGIEGGVPLYQYLNGLQLKTDWFLTAGAQLMF